MGSVVSPAARYAVSAAVGDPDTLVPADRITGLELVSDGGTVVASRSVSGHNAIWVATVSSTTARYLWLRVTTAGGVTAWTAPVWIGR